MATVASGTPSVVATAASSTPAPGVSTGTATIASGNPSVTATATATHIVVLTAGSGTLTAGTPTIAATATSATPAAGISIGMAFIIAGVPEIRAASGIPGVGTVVGPAWDHRTGATIIAGSVLYERRPGQIVAGTLSDGNLTWRGGLTIIGIVFDATANVFSLHSTANPRFNDTYSQASLEAVFVVYGNEYGIFPFYASTQIGGQMASWAIPASDPRRALLASISAGEEFDIIESGSTIVGPRVAW